MLAWPHAGTDWQDRLEEVETVYTHILAAICTHENALLLCPDDKHQDEIIARLNKHGVDTDQIIPSREMKSVSKTGLSGGLFVGQRYTIERIENPDALPEKRVLAGTLIPGSSSNS